VSADLPADEIKGPPRAVRVQAIFHVTDEQQRQAVVAKMIDRAHEIANLPECECDVDVSVETEPPNGSLASGGPSGAPLHGRAPNS
jgi:hypothetical protein